MADLINLTIDGKAVTAPPGTLVINAAKQVGIEVPAFCYYDGLALQAACRMCLVEVEKTPSLKAACTLPAPGARVFTPVWSLVRRRGRGPWEFPLTNLRPDCRVAN